MLDPDRLAAYLADELDADARREVERALTTDPGERDRLAAMRRADETLAQRTSPPLPDGFTDRLGRRLDEVLAETIGDLEDPTEQSTSPTPAGVASPGDARTAHDGPVGASAPHDELAARRTRRWVPATAAAGLLLIAGGLAIVALPGGDDAETMDAADAPADGRVETFSTDEADDADAEMFEESAIVVDRPVIVADGREAEGDVTDTLLLEDDLVALADEQLSRSDGLDRAADFQAQLGASAPGEESDPAEPSAPTDDAGTMDTDADDVPLTLVTRDGEELDLETSATIRRCLDTLLEAGPSAIPAYVELLDVEGQAVVVFGLVTIEPDRQAFTRREVWVLERATCQPVRFAQS